VIRFARALVDAFRLALARDRLGPAPAAQGTVAPRTPGILHLLLVSREPLGIEPESPRRSRSVVRTIFAPEKLPFDPEPAPAQPRRGRLAALLAPEQLDDDSP
jgi:hypothetical protein